MFDSFLDDSHRMFRESCEAFVASEVRPQVEQWEEAESFPVELYRKAGEAGLLGVNLPEAYGGGGGDLFHLIMMIEAFLPCGSTGVLAGLGSHAIALPPILELGTEDQKQRWIPPVLRGETVAALAITEPDAGSDVAAITTRARRDGDDYVLDGRKLYITSGARAGLVTVLARTGEAGHGGLTFFVVESDRPGYGVSRALRKTGWRASDTVELVFEDCRVPAENRLGDEGSGFRALMKNFLGERLALAAYGSATAEAALAEAERFCRARQAFGKPLLAHQVTRHKLARMATLTRAAKALVYQAAASMERGEDATEAVSEAKLFGAEVAEEVTREAVQLHGGQGYCRESVVERLSRDARLLSIGGGTDEIMKEIIARCRGYRG